MGFGPAKLWQSLATPERRKAWGRTCFWLVMVVWAFVMGVLVGQGAIVSSDQVDSMRSMLGLDQPGPAAQEPSAKAPAPELSYHKELERGPDQKPAPVPAAPPPSPSRLKGKFSVQVASFKEDSQAQELAGRLRAAGLPSFVLPSRVKGVGLRYRVRVGPYEEAKSAHDAAGRIRLQLRLAAYVTRED